MFCNWYSNNPSQPSAFQNLWMHISNVMILLHTLFIINQHNYPPMSIGKVQTFIKPSLKLIYENLKYLLVLGNVIIIRITKELLPTKWSIFL